jgi:hypothetical protein
MSVRKFIGAQCIWCSRELTPSADLLPMLLGFWRDTLQNPSVTTKDLRETLAFACDVLENRFLEQTTRPRAPIGFARE